MKNILITGIAGFIGTHLQKALQDNFLISGIDDLSVSASHQRLKTITATFIENSIHSSFIDSLETKPEIVVHLAAETGIPGSLKNPQLYFHQNVEGTFNVLEQCRKNGVKYLIYASSSSVYEPNEVMHENAPHDCQLSFYGTTKRMTEVMVENYCRQFGMIAIGLRFFTVYGSWTRPDMAAYKFMKAIHQGEEITIYNEGEIYRDFTHVSDIVESIRLLCHQITKEKQGYHQLFNIGHGQPVSVQKYAELIASNLNQSLQVKTAELPSNELVATHSSTENLQNYIGYTPKCTIEDGIKEMVEWFQRENYES